MEIINLTPHPINIIGKNNFCVINSYRENIRLVYDVNNIDVIDYNGIDIEIKYTNFSPNNFVLPPEKEKVYYIVSLAVALNTKDRNDLLFPFDLQRGENGEVLGCSCLAKLDKNI